MSKISWNWWEVSDKKLFFAFLKKTTFLKVELNLEEHSKGPIMALPCFQNKVAKYNPVEIVWSHVWNSPPVRPSMGQWVVVLITICYLLLHRQSPLRRILYLLQEYCHLHDRPWLSSIGDLSRVLLLLQCDQIAQVKSCQMVINCPILFCYLIVNASSCTSPHDTAGVVEKDEKTNLKISFSQTLKIFSFFSIGHSNFHWLNFSFCFK